MSVDQAGGANVRGPLDGLVVIDASWGLPGGAGTLLLADYGARVIKVERPGGGPDASSVARQAWDRNKESVELDLDDQGDRAKLRRLLAAADVFVHSMTPGRAEARGLGIADLQVDLPELIVTAVTGYGQHGPLVDRPGYDALIAARLGLLAEQPGHREGPIFCGHQHIAIGTGFLAAIGTLAAIRARRISGRGQLVDVSLLDSALAQCSMNWWWNESEISYLARSEKMGFGRQRVLIDLFECADGEYLMLHTGGQGLFKRTMDILGFGDVIRSTGDEPEMGVPLADDEMEARDSAATAFKQRSRDEWLKLFLAEDVAVLPILRPGEILHDVQIDHAGMRHVIDTPHGPLQQSRPGISFSSYRLPDPVPAPAVGEHNALLDTGLPPRAAVPATGARLSNALEGLRVLDFSAYFATAYAAKLLGDLGADVIKIEPPSQDPMRGVPDPFEACQRGKRNIVIDMKSPEAMAIVHDLVRGADVVLHNFRPGKAEQIGLGYDDLKALKPDLIYGHLPGYGVDGPRAFMKSFAPLLSGFSGLNYEGAGEGNPPVRRVLGNEDFYNGFFGAMSTLMALEHRSRTGEGQKFEVSQLHAMLFVTTGNMLDEHDRVVRSPSLDAEQTGWSPLYRLYETSDGWIALGCVGDACFDRLRVALDMPGLDAQADDLATTLASAFAGRTTAEALSLLEEHCVPAEHARTDVYMDEFLWEEWATDTMRVFEQHHPTIGWIREIGLSIHLSETPGLKRGPGALLGQHSREVLEELGYDDETVEKLLASVCRGR